MLTRPARRRAGVDYVVVFSAPLEDVERNVALIRQPDPRRGRRSRCSSRSSPATSWRARCRRRVRRLERAARGGGARATSRARVPGRLRRRARPARARARRRCSASSPSSRRRAQALHRHRLARAAHADLLARRLPRAARGRGARRGDARASSSRQLREQVDAARQAGDRAARPLAPGGGLARAAPRADRPRRARPRRSPPSSRRRSRRTSPSSSCASPASRSRPTCDPERVAQILRILIDNALDPHPGRHRRRRLGRERRNGRVRLAVTDFGAGIKRSDMPPHLRALLHLRRRAGLRPRPGDRPRAGRAHGRRAVAPQRVPGRTTFALELPGMRAPRAGLAASPPLAVSRAAAAAARDDDDGDSSQTTDDHGRGRSSRPGDGRGPSTPAAIYERESPGVVTIIAFTGGLGSTSGGDGSGGGGLGSGFVHLRRRRDRHQRPRRHQRRGPAHQARPRRSTCASPTATRSRRRIVGFDPFADVALLKIDPAGLTLRPLPLGSTHGPRRRRAGGRDRQPVRRGAVAVGRRHLRARPLDRSRSPASPSPARSRPTRRSTTATPAARCSTPRPRARHQPADPDSTAATARASASRSRSTGQALARRSCAAAGKRALRLPRRRHARRSTRSSPTRFGLGVRHGAWVQDVTAGGPAAARRPPAPATATPSASRSAPTARAATSSSRSTGTPVRARERPAPTVAAGLRAGRRR